MKKFFRVFGVLICLGLVAALGYNGLKNTARTEKTEFLFDTVCTITVFERNCEKIVTEAFDEAAQIFDEANFFDDESDVSRINNAEAGERVAVSENIIEMLDMAKMVNEKSKGAFDITIAPVSMLWKFDEESPVPPTEDEILAELWKVGRDKLHLDKEQMTVLKEFSETRIDLGGIAKGYAADKAVECLKSRGVESGIVDFGGNIVAFGENPASKNHKWRIGIQKPFSPTGEYASVVEIDGGAVVTSGIYQRFFDYQGRRYHHIIDPENGMPAAQEFESVSVVGEGSALMDCIATAVYVLGKTHGEALAREFGVEVLFCP